MSDWLQQSACNAESMGSNLVRNSICGIGTLNSCSAILSCRVCALLSFACFRKRGNIKSSCIVLHLYCIDKAHMAASYTRLHLDVFGIYCCYSCQRLLYSTLNQLISIRSAIPTLASAIHFRSRMAKQGSCWRLFQMSLVKASTKPRPTWRQSSSGQTVMTNTDTGSKSATPRPEKN